MRRHRPRQRLDTLDTRVVVGGPTPTTAPEEFAAADLVFQGERDERVEVDPAEPRHLVTVFGAGYCFDR